MKSTVARLIPQLGRDGERARTVDAEDGETMDCKIEDAGGDASGVWN